jgi:CubicO group peptidase (beta-lactamase class C family)
MEDLKIPLIFEPGAMWMYGKSLDWAGQVVEAVSGMNLDEYMKRNIFAPLGMDSTTFFQEQRPDIMAKRFEMQHRPVEGHPLAAQGDKCEFCDDHQFEG